MLEHGGAKVLPVIPQLIVNIRQALLTRNHEIVCETLKVLQRLIICAELSGKGLVPFYRQIMPILNLFKICLLYTSPSPRDRG